MSGSNDASRAKIVPTTSSNTLQLELQQKGTGPDLETAPVKLLESPKLRGIGDGPGLSSAVAHIGSHQQTRTRGADTGAVNSPTIPTGNDRGVSGLMSVDIGQRLWTQAYQTVAEDPDFSPLLEQYKGVLKAHENSSHEGMCIFESPQHLNYKRDDSDNRGAVERMSPEISGNNSDELAQIQKMANGMLDTLSHTHLSFSIRGKTIVVQDQVRELVKVVLAFKDVIGSAISAEPHATLAWAAVLVALPVGSSHTTDLEVTPVIPNDRY